MVVAIGGESLYDRNSSWSHITIVTSPPKLVLPPLANGDRLTRDEFERRYAAMPHVQKAELIEGVVYMAAALRFKSHGKPHGDLTTWMGVYKVMTPGVELGVEPTIRLDLGNEPQPDAVLIIEPDRGGQARLSEDDYIAGAPELVAEIAASSAALTFGRSETIDSTDKKRADQRNGIQEYIIWRVFDRRLDWFSLQNGEYVMLPVDEDGVIRSLMFPGLWLAVEALLSGDMVQVLATVQAGIASGEHAEFVAQLKV